jgi:hypothetical protein
MLEEAYGKMAMKKRGFTSCKNVFVMRTKQLVSSARQRTYTSVVCGRKVPYNVTALEHPSHPLDLPLPCYSVSGTEKCSEGTVIRDSRRSHCRSDESTGLETFSFRGKNK